MTTNVERELGKLESQIENLSKRQDKVEQDFKTEVNTLKNDIKDLKRELQGDFKELKKSVDDISLSINDLKSFDSNNSNIINIFCLYSISTFFKVIIFQN